VNRPPAQLAGAPLREDLLQIARMIPAQARVLDVGCGDGRLLDHLMREKQVDGRGIELSQAGVNACVAQGLSVVQGDADKDLVDYPSDSFDFVILSQTLQATRRPRSVLLEMLRIGRFAVVSFPNFGHWRVRQHLLLRGRMPVTALLSQAWYKTPNIHLCTIRDFLLLCDKLDIAVEKSLALDEAGRAAPLGGYLRVANLLSVQALFLLRKGPDFTPTPA